MQKSTVVVLCLLLVVGALAVTVTVFGNNIRALLGSSSDNVVVEARSPQ